MNSTPAPISTRLASLLPPFCYERCTVRREGPIAERGTFVLYIPRNALRADENPALDAARAAASGLKLPLVIHALFDSKSLHATARRATFVLQGLRELALRFDSTEELFTFQLLGQRGASRQPAHLVLAARAAVIFIDEPFVEPHLSVVNRISRKTKTRSPPVVTVDASCIVPARLVPREQCNRAYAYRSATASQRRERALAPWPVPVVASTTTSPDCLNLPMSLFTDLTAEGLSIAALVESLEGLDHAVPACSHTRGGASHALGRWKQYLARLSTYDKTRNDPLKHYSGGVSRMSAYLNLGMASPFTVMRDAVKRNQAKFLDELGVWRGISYTWCFHNPRHRVSARDALPAWAFRTLSEHANDHGEPLALGQLEHAQSGTELWDICQRSLVLHGELHNNLRMTWGKEVLRWTSGPEMAYAYLLHLNDRYALDGLSPCSVTGLLWCLGWGDSPKGSDSTRIFGRVRPRSAASISRRYDLTKLDAMTRNGPVNAPAHQTLFEAFSRSARKSNSNKKRKVAM